MEADIVADKWQKKKFSFEKFKKISNIYYVVYSTVL